MCPFIDKSRVQEASSLPVRGSRSGRCPVAGRPRARDSRLGREPVSDDGEVAVVIATNAIRPNFELALLDHDEPKPVSWNQLCLASVV